MNTEVTLAPLFAQQSGVWCVCDSWKRHRPALDCNVKDKESPHSIHSKI